MTWQGPQTCPLIKFCDFCRFLKEIKTQSSEDINPRNTPFFLHSLHISLAYHVSIIHPHFQASKTGL